MKIKFEIKNYWTGKILFSLETETMKQCVEKAVLNGADLRGADLRDADLRGADLRGAVLRDAVLRGADLRDAVLRGAVLRDADLRDADLNGADLRGAVTDVDVATDEQAIVNLDKVREIILDNAARLKMDHWHGDGEWKQRSCAEEMMCGTTHCLAGWLQVCSPDEKIRKLEASTAGVVLAPVAAKMFYRSNDEVLKWLTDREYAK